MNLRQYRSLVKGKTNLTFEEYNILSKETSGNHDAFYFRFKLAGEVGELMEYWGKVMRGDFEEDPEHVKDELGDVLWYVAALARQYGFTLEDVAWDNVEKLRERYPNGFNLEDRYVNEEEKERER